MTAAEARELSEKHNVEKVAVVLDKIKKTAGSGYTKMYWYDHLTDSQRQVLAKLGYRIGEEQWDLKDQTPFTLIEW